MRASPSVGSRSASFGSVFPFVGRAARAASIALGLMLGSGVASAEPVRVITDGFFGSGGDDTGFWALGSDFYLQTAALPAAMGPIVSCSPCTPGSEINLSATVTIQDWGPGSATLNGQTANVYYGGFLTFTAGSVVVPDVPPQPPGLDDTSIVTAHTTFTFMGTLIGFADPSLTAPLFSSQLVGGGTLPLGAVAGFGNLGSGVFLDYADYHFDSASAVPEPGSLLLFGSGAAWVVARRRQRRRAAV